MRSYYLYFLMRCTFKVLGDLLPVGERISYFNMSFQAQP